jgi:ABC-type nickel/cobalt efflux system permease component RcnA
MTRELTILAFTAASIAFFHTLLGPDHYLPFIVMARARKWSPSRTAWITFLCGIGHIGGSVLLGFVGVALGIAVTKIKTVEAMRGDLAAWFLIAFGLVYFVWGLRRMMRSRPHEHQHIHGDGQSHNHRHVHASDHLHVHEKESIRSLTPWILFIIFVFGPCEPLIPLLMYPAAKSSHLGLVLVTGIFGGVTIATMMGVVLVSHMGLKIIPVGRLGRYSHAVAGATVCLCGLTIKFLGL